MKSLKTLSSALFLALALSTAASQAGDGTSTSGADLDLDQNNPWNLGETPVEYCIEISPSFGYTHDVLAELIQESLGEWRTFFRKYHLDEKKFNALSDGRSRGLALDFVEVARCTDRATQIRMLFGAPDSEIRNVVDATDQAFGLALRERYNHKTYRNGGILWIRTQRYAPNELKHVLSHELGHVFGMRHDTVSIMQSNLAEQFLAPAYFKDGFGKIETPAWPYRFLPGDTIDYTYNGRHTESAGYRSEPNLFLRGLKGVIPHDENGFHQLQLSYDEGTLDSRYNHLLRLTIRMAGTDETYEMRGRFTFRGNLARFGMEEPHLGPELYTLSRCRSCGIDGSIRRIHLDTPTLILPAEGSFEINGSSYPALLDQRNGPYLRIFNPSIGMWWGIDFYSGGSFLRQSP
jgi:hypothetical protein